MASRAQIASRLPSEQSAAGRGACPARAVYSSGSRRPLFPGQCEDFGEVTARGHGDCVQSASALLIGGPQLYFCTFAAVRESSTCRRPLRAYADAGPGGSGAALEGLRRAAFPSARPAVPAQKVPRADGRPRPRPAACTAPALARRARAR